MCGSVCSLSIHHNGLLKANLLCDCNAINIPFTGGGGRVVRSLLWKRLVPRTKEHLNALHMLMAGAQPLSQSMLERSGAEGAA